MKGKSYDLELVLKHKKLELVEKIAYKLTINWSLWAPFCGCLGLAILTLV